ncbi:MAG: hypothetical protein M1609_07550 [Firmicutes bacterium]|nr:hypothetical protein [Bacillota bacterium]
MSCWSICELQYMIDYYIELGPSKVAKNIGRDPDSVSGMAGVLGIRRDREPEYSEEDVQYLRKNWGKMTVKALAKKLKRSEASVETKAKKLKLGPIYNQGNFTQNEIEKITGINHQSLKRYIDQSLIKAAWSKSEKGGMKQILPKELERFLRENPDKWDSRKAKDVIKAIHAKELECEKTKVRRSEGAINRKVPEILRDGFIEFVVQVAMDASDRIADSRKGPEWFRQKLEQDQSRYPRECIRWTPEEDALLRKLYKENKLTYKEIGKRLGRSAGAVNSRLARIIIWDEQSLKNAK